MSRVFIPHETMVFDHALQMRRQKFDFSSAMNYGDLVYLLAPSQAAATNPAQAKASIVAALTEHFYEPENDFLLATGDPVIYGWTYHECAKIAPIENVRVLRWDKRFHRYDIC